MDKTRTVLGRALATAVAAVGILAASVLPAAAHVSVTSSTAEAGAYAVLSFSVPHGCAGAPTTAVAVAIPDGITSVTPTRNPYYTLEVVTTALDEPAVDGHGAEVTERVSEVVWTALEPLPDGQRDVLELSVRLSDDAAGSTLYFPTVQTCGDQESAWIEIPADGQDPHDLALPAPSLAVVAGGGGDGHGHSDATPEEEAATVTSVSAPLTWLAAGVGALGVALGGAALTRSIRRA